MCAEASRLGAAALQSCRRVRRRRTTEPGWSSTLRRRWKPGWVSALGLFTPSSASAHWQHHLRTDTRRASCSLRPPPRRQRHWGRESEITLNKEASGDGGGGGGGGVAAERWGRRLGHNPIPINLNSWTSFCAFNYVWVAVINTLTMKHNLPHLNTLKLKIKLTEGAGERLNSHQSLFVAHPAAAVRSTQTASGFINRSGWCWWWPWWRFSSCAGFSQGWSEPESSRLLFVIHPSVGLETRGGFELYILPGVMEFLIEPLITVIRRLWNQNLKQHQVISVSELLGLFEEKCLRQ